MHGAERAFAACLHTALYNRSHLSLERTTLRSMFSFAKKLVDRLESASHSDSQSNDSYFKQTLRLNNNGYALRVLNVVPHSKAHQLGFESWFDYIIRVNNQELPMNNPSISNFNYSINDDGTVNYGGQATMEQAGLVNFDLLTHELNTIANSNNGSKSVTLDVWSAKGGIIRQIVVPLEAFSSTSKEFEPSDDEEPLFKDRFSQIGLTIQSQHINTASYVWRILNTHPGSPAFQAQLIPNSDYIIGCDSTFESDHPGKGLLARGGESLLSRTVLSYYNHHFAILQQDNIPITLYVYNHDYDILRPVTVNLSRSWASGGSKGILGCDVGYGLLHRIPEVIGKYDGFETVDDVLYENDTNLDYELPDQKSSSQPHPPIDPAHTFVPQSAPIAPPPPKAARRKKHHGPAASNELSDFMNEELNKSKEQDVKYNQTAEAANTPPPPPPLKHTS